MIRIMIHVILLNIPPDRSLSLHLFAASQIHQVEFAAELLLRLSVLLFDVDQKNAVAPGAVLVHV